MHYLCNVIHYLAYPSMYFLALHAHVLTCLHHQWSLRLPLLYGTEATQEGWNVRVCEFSTFVSRYPTHSYDIFRDHRLSLV